MAGDYGLVLVESSRACRLWQPVGNEIRYSSSGRRIHIGQHGNDVAGSGADLQFAIHSGSAAAVTEASRAVNLLIPKSVRIGVIGRSCLACGQQLRVMRIEQLVSLQRTRKLQQIFYRG